MHIITKSIYQLVRSESKTIYLILGVQKKNECRPILENDQKSNQIKSIKTKRIILIFLFLSALLYRFT